MRTVFLFLCLWSFSGQAVSLVSLDHKGTQVGAPSPLVDSDYLWDGKQLSATLTFQGKQGKSCLDIYVSDLPQEAKTMALELGRDYVRFQDRLGFAWGLSPTERPRPQCKVVSQVLKEDEISLDLACRNLKDQDRDRPGVVHFKVEGWKIKRSAE